LREEEQEKLLREITLKQRRMPGGSWECRQFRNSERSEERSGLIAGL
jgi:hypothetical protein